MSKPDAASRVRYRAEHGVVGRIEQCGDGWCHITIGKREGYIRTADIWGVERQAKCSTIKGRLGMKHCNCFSTVRRHDAAGYRPADRARRRAYRQADARRAAAALLRRGAGRRHGLSVGAIGIGADGKLPAGIEAQARQTMDNIGAVLKAQGLGWGDVVKCTVMLDNMADWPAFNTVYVTYFPDGKFPARSAFGADGLALGALVEVECIAFAGKVVAIRSASRAA